MYTCAVLPSRPLRGKVTIAKKIVPTYILYKLIDFKHIVMSSLRMFTKKLKCNVGYKTQKKYTSVHYKR